MRKRFEACLGVIALCFVACGRDPTEAEKQAEAAQRLADERAAQAQAQADDARDRAAVLLIEAKVAFRKAVESELEALSTRIDALRQTTVRAKGRAKTDAGAAIADLAERRTTIERQLRGLDELSATELEQAKKQIEEALAALRAQLSEAEGRLRI